MIDACQLGAVKRGTAMNSTNDILNSGESIAVDAPVALDTWVKPEIVSFKPLAAAQGISYNPLDGISNLS
jgi:hypothetical protein